MAFGDPTGGCSNCLQRCPGQEDAQLIRSDAIQTLARSYGLKAVHPAMGIQVLDLDRLFLFDPVPTQNLIQPPIRPDHTALHEHIANDAIHKRRMNAMSPPMVYMDIGPQAKISSKQTLSDLTYDFHDQSFKAPAKYPVE